MPMFVQNFAVSDALVFTHSHTHTHTCIHIHTDTCTHITQAQITSAQMCMFAHICTHTLTHIHILACTHTHTHTIQFASVREVCQMFASDIGTCCTWLILVNNLCPQLCFWCLDLWCVWLKGHRGKGRSRGDLSPEPHVELTEVNTNSSPRCSCDFLTWCWTC